MKYYNKETRNTNGDYYRTEDWGIDKKSSPGENFTNIKPNDICISGMFIPCDWDDEKHEWVVDIDILKNKKLIEIKNNLENAVSDLKDHYGQTEIDSWETQIVEARLFKIDSSNPTPNIDIMIDEGIEDKELFIDSILENEASFKAIVFKAIGQRVSKSDAIKKISDNDSLSNNDKTEQIINSDVFISLK